MQFLFYVIFLATIAYWASVQPLQADVRGIGTSIRVCIFNDHADGDSLSKIHRIGKASIFLRRSPRFRDDGSRVILPRWQRRPDALAGEPTPRFLERSIPDLDVVCEANSESRGFPVVCIMPSPNYLSTWSVGVLKISWRSQSGVGQPDIWPLVLPKIAPSKFQGFLRYVYCPGSGIGLFLRLQQGRLHGLPLGVSYSGIDCGRQESPDGTNKYSYLNSMGAPPLFIFLLFSGVVSVYKFTWELVFGSILRYGCW